MVFNCVPNGKIATVSLSGAVDNDHARELGDELQALLAKPFDAFVFHMADVLFMSSLAIGLFLIFYKDLISSGKTMQIKGISDQVFEVFHSIKLDTLIPVEK